MSGGKKPHICHTYYAAAISDTHRQVIDFARRKTYEERDKNGLHSHRHEDSASVHPARGDHLNKEVQQNRHIQQVNRHGDTGPEQTFPISVNEEKHILEIAEGTIGHIEEKHIHHIALFPQRPQQPCPHDKEDGRTSMHKMCDGFICRSHSCHKQPLSSPDKDSIFPNCCKSI